MTTTLTIPKSNVPIGKVSINGQEIDVMQSPEITRFLFDLSRRVGGVTAQTNGDLHDAVTASDTSIEGLALTPPAYVAPAEINEPGGRLESLEARIEQIARAIADLQLGPQP